ncbi:MAG: sterol desaturase family protein [Myxococcales bacterium]|nr:sterol desaturase family protein [Myxococcales bacterium]
MSEQIEGAIDAIDWPGSRPRLRAFVRRGLYPVCLGWVAACIAYGLAHPEQLVVVLAVKGGVLVGGLLLLEWLVPYRRLWRMTWRHLWRRDLVFIAINGATLAGLSYGLVALSIEVSAGTRGLITAWPLWSQVVVGLLAFETLQYTIHRWMHTSRGAWGGWLWRTHAIHHLPQQLYVVMHAVFHPFNAIIVRLGVQLLPLWVLGYTPEAAFVFGSITALHGTFSHLNLDVRAGWLNYVFVGPELHRVHHAADVPAGNYAATLSIFDWALGTFHYQPGAPPRALGLRRADGYPGQHEPLRALALPLG